MCYHTKLFQDIVLPTPKGDLWSKDRSASAGSMKQQARARDYSDTYQNNGSKQAISTCLAHVSCISNTYQVTFQPLRQQTFWFKKPMFEPKRRLQILHPQKISRI